MTSRPRPTRIWMINPNAIPPTMSGGTRHYDFGVELTRRGYDVSIFATDININTRRHEVLRFGQLCKSQDFDGVRFVWVNAVRYQVNNWRRVLNFLSFMFNTVLVGLFRKRPVVIIGSSPHPFSALAGLILSRLKRARFVLEIRDLWPQTLIEANPKLEGTLGVKVMRWAERLLYRKAELIVVLAKGSIDYIAERGRDRDSIVFIPNGVHLGHFKSSRPREETRRALDFGDRFVVMYAGAHGQLNALHTILGAAEITRDRDDILYALVGDGVAKQELRDAAAEKELTNVRFLDPVPKTDVPDLFSAADALTITLLNVDLFGYGVSPNKLFDYLATNRPVICAVGGDMAAMVREAGAGVAVEPENPEEMAAVVAEWADHPERMECFIGPGRAFIEQHYSRQQLVEQLLARLGLPAEAAS